MIDKPHLQFFWGFWHVYKSKNTTKRNLIGAGKTPDEAMKLFQDHVRNQNERARKQRSKTNPSRRQNPSRRRRR